MKSIVKFIYMRLFPVVTLFYCLCAIFPEIAFPGLEPDVFALRITAALFAAAAVFVYYLVKMLDEAEELHAATPLTFTAWYHQNSENIKIGFAESGADRELGFNEERAMEIEYELYLKRWENGRG